MIARFGVEPSATFFLGTKLSVTASQGSQMCMLLGLCPSGEFIIQYERGVHASWAHIDGGVQAAMKD